MHSQEYQSAAQRYAHLSTTRESYLRRARDASVLTIPSLIPPEGHSDATTYETPFQAVGARGVNNLASKLLMALLPPNAPFFRLTIDDFDIVEVAGPEARGAVEEALARIERTAMGEVETLALRVPVFEILKHLIVGGNGLLYMPKKGSVKFYRLDRYVVKRDYMGNLMEIITHETVSPMMLPKEAQEILKDDSDKANNIDLYTCVKRTDRGWKVHQEVMGEMIKGTEGTYPLDKNPFIPLRLNRIDGEDYGRGFVEEYIGDLRSLEQLTRAIVEGSAASSKVLFLVAPNGTTKAKTLAESANGAIVQGNAADVSTLQVQKGGDFAVALQTISQITERLSFAFLLNSSVQRNAERVTAEEVRFMAQELESALGGVYSILSQEFQLPLVKLLLNRLQSMGKMPKMPKDSIKPQIVTGIEALGRGQDLNKLAQMLNYLQPLGPEVIQKYMNVGDYIDRLGASLGIDTGGLIKSEQELAQEQQQMAEAQQQQMMQEMMGKMAERAAPELAKQQQQQPQ